MGTAKVLVALSLLLVLLVPLAARAASMYGNVTLADLERSLRRLLEKGGAINVDEVRASLERLSKCALNASRSIHALLRMLDEGGWNASLAHKLVASCPSCFSRCNASDVYTILLAGFARRVGNTLAYSNSTLVEELLPLLRVPPYLWVDLKSLFGGDPRYWSALVTLALGVRVDDRFWALLESTGGPRLLCLAATVVDARVVEPDSYLVKRLAPRGVHPLALLSRLVRSDRLVCAYAASRLYALSAPPEAQQLYTLYAIGEVVEGHLSVTALALLLRGKHLVTLGGRVAPAFLVEVVSSLERLPDPFRYELCCLSRSLEKGGLEPSGPRAACSRSFELLGLVRANWLAWGRYVYTSRITELDVEELEKCAGVNTTIALRHCLNATLVPNVTRAGCMARLAAVTGDRLDWVKVRLCASRLLGVPVSDLVPRDPLAAWAMGYIGSVKPPGRDALGVLGRIVEAWRLAEKVGAKELASRLARLAVLVAEGNVTGIREEVAKLRSLILSISTLISSNPRLATLVAQVVAINATGGVIRVDIGEAARILSRMLDVDVNTSRAVIEGRTAKILEMLAKGLLSPAEAKRLIEALNIPEDLRKQLEIIVARIEGGDASLYYRLIRVLAPVAAAPAAPGGRLHLVAPGDPAPLLAGIALAAILAVIYHYHHRLAGLIREFRLPRRPRLEEYQRELLRLLAVLSRRYGERREWETLREYLSRLPADAGRILGRVVRLYEEARYARRNRDRALEAIREARRELGG